MHTATEQRPDAQPVESSPPEINFQAVYRQLPVPIALLDSNFHFLDYNDAFGDLLGYDRKDLIGQVSHTIIASDVVPDVLKTRERFRSGQISVENVERVVVTRDGRRLFVVAQISTFQNGSDPCLYLVVYHDVSQARQRERLLLDRAELFRVAVDQSPIPLTIQDADYRFVMVNQAFCDMMGYTEQELLRRDPIDFHTPESREIMLQTREAFSENASFPWSSERALVAKDGTVVPYMLMATSSVGIDGTPLIAAVLENRVHLEKARAALVEQNKWLIRVFNHSPAGMMFAVPDGKFLRANRVLQDMIGSSDVDVLGRLLPRGANECDEPGKTFVGSRLALRRPGQDTQWLDRITSTVRHFDGSLRTVTVVTDVTREQQLQADLQSAVAQQAALLQSMDAGLAHVIGELIVRVNPALVTLCGKPSEALLGQPIEVLFEREGQWADFWPAQSGAGLKPNTGIVELRGPAGEPLRCEVTVRQVDPMRTDLGLLLTFKDVSQWLNQNDDLTRSLEDLETLIETEPLGLAHLQNGRIIRVNRAMRRLVERDSNELIGQRFEALCTLPHEVARHIDRSASSADNDLLLRATLLGANGLQTDCVLHVAHVGDPERGAVIIMVLDLSSQAKVASLALKMQGRFEAFSSLLNEAMVVVENTTGQIIHANAALADVLGLEVASVVGTGTGSLWGYLSDADRHSAAGCLKRLVQGSVSTLSVQVAHPQSGDLSIRLRMFIGEGGRESFILAEDVTASLQLEQQRLEDAVSQKEDLVREVHHRIKNNLQGVAGLLQQSAMREPMLSDILGEVAGQIHAVAQVHGLQIQDQRLSPEGVVLAISENLRHTFGQKICFQTGDDQLGQAEESGWLVPEQEAVPFALVINEIITNAFKHGDEESDVNIALMSDESSFSVLVSNVGSLPRDFDLSTLPVSPCGLGLIKALMPKRGAHLALTQKEAGRVEAFIELRSPALVVAGVRESAGSTVHDV